MKLSVIIPVYNVAAYLSECTESLRAQTLTDWEAVLVDDGSTDGSGEICDATAASDSRFRVIHQKNGGLSRARNAGSEAASGEYLYFLDSDDTVVPETLRLLTETAERTGAELILFDGLLTDENGIPGDGADAHRRKGDYPEKAVSGAELFGLLFENGEFMSPVPYLFMKRTVWERQRFTPDVLYEDVLFTVNALLNASSATVLKEPLYRYRTRGGSIMNGGTSEKHYESLLKVYRLLEKRLPETEGTPAKTALTAELAELYRAEYLLYLRLPGAVRKKERQNRDDFRTHVLSADYASETAAFSVPRMKYAAFAAREKLRNMIKARK